MKVSDLTGTRIGCISVFEFSHFDKHGRALWLVQCDCGKRAVMRIRNTTKTCGCARGGIVTHGATDSPEYRAWQEMKRRCRNSTRPGSQYYVSRGVSVCERWKSSFENFIADMGRKPSPSHSIDRINNDGNYEPGNCRWATPKEQVANRRPFARRGRYSKPKEERA